METRQRDSQLHFLSNRLSSIASTRGKLLNHRSLEQLQNAQGKLSSNRFIFGARNDLEKSAISSAMTTASQRNICSAVLKQRLYQHSSAATRARRTAKLTYLYPTRTSGYGFLSTPATPYISQTTSPALSPSNSQECLVTQSEFGDSGGYMERRLEELADPLLAPYDDDLPNHDWRGLADILKPVHRAPGITHKLCGVIEEK